MPRDRKEDFSPAVLDVAQLCMQIDGKTQVNDINLQLRAGEKVCLLGASGSGKSLTAKAIIGTPPAHAELSGSIRVMGQEVLGRHPLMRNADSRVAAIFQDSASALNPLMTMGKQLLLPKRGDDETALDALLQQVGLGHLDDLKSRYPAQLSGGQRQRVCIALALMSRSKVLVADEPTTALDVISQRQVVQVLQQVCASADSPALLFITHDIAVAAQLCDRALVMQQGRVVESASMRQLLAHPQHPYTRQLIAAVQLSTPLASAIAL